MELVISKLSAALNRGRLLFNFASRRCASYSRAALISVFTVNKFLNKKSKVKTGQKASVGDINLTINAVMSYVVIDKYVLLKFISQTHFIFEGEFLHSLCT